ncbi:MAG TPA: hypothetical protein VF743_10835 [Acidimicrobiales bacterium]
MGGYSAESRNINFAYSEALNAAKDLYALAGVVREKHRARATEAGKAVDRWEGGHRSTFDAKLRTEGTDVDTIATALVSLAHLFATRWSEARGEQDRINFARYVQHEKDDDGWAENSWEWVAGEDDYGEPPGNPPVPEPPLYHATRGPMHSEFGP